MHGQWQQTATGWIHWHYDWCNRLWSYQWHPATAGTYQDHRGRSRTPPGLHQSPFSPGFEASQGSRAPATPDFEFGNANHLAAPVTPTKATSAPVTPPKATARRPPRTKPHCRRPKQKRTGNRTLRRWIRTDQLSSILRTRWSTGGCRLTSMFCLDLLTNTRLSGANCMASVSDSEGAMHTQDKRCARPPTCERWPPDVRGSGSEMLP